MMIGATPATFTNSGCTTPSEMPAATPASIALPPASRILKLASAARYWVGAIMWCVPMMVGRWDFMLAPLRQGLVSLDGVKTQVARDRARDQPMYAPRFFGRRRSQIERLTQNQVRPRGMAARAPGWASVIR